MTTTQQTEIQTAEDASNAYMDEHYGPMWDMDNQTEANRLHAIVVALYDRYNVAEDDRIF